ncbi:MAG TPA: Crp/Fnr family transcriptional regulator [Acidimicrobiia bacterium]|nr:Crp/Fnr family transcriptional regulator [Acidimicrobiia bacterium]
MTDVHVLASTQLINELPGDVIESLRTQAEVRHFERNELIFQEGDRAEELYVVQMGQVAIATKSVDGRESVVAVLEPPSLFGELPLFDEAPRMADARALQPTDIVAVRYEHVRAVLDERPQLLWGIVRLLAQRLRSADEALADAVLLDVPGRTAKRLLELAGDADDFATSLTQEELAALIGASRERVNKALATFQRLGWIENIERGRYRILNRPALEQRSSM